MAEVKADRKASADKREMIMLAAVEMFLEKDYYQVTIIEIARQAGVGKGTVYEYFTSKEELFKECFSHCAETYIQSFKSHFNSNSQVKSTMQNILSTHLEMIRDNRRRLHLLFNERPLSFQELQAWVFEQRQELLAGIVSLVNEGVASGELRCGINTDLAGRLFLALNYVVMGGMVVLDNADFGEAELQSLLDLYFHGVSGPGF